MSRRLWPLALIAFLAACTQVKPPPPPDRLVLTSAAFGDLAGWGSDGVGEALAALKKSCARRLRFADDAQVGPQGLAGKVVDWRLPCTAAASIDEHDDGAARAFFETWFRPYRCANNDASEGLFTGYYEPELKGARTRGGNFETPLMKRPPDLVAVDLGDFRADWRGERIAGRVVGSQLKPYPDRLGIERGALANRNLELVWVDDAIDAFFVQIQGSGRVALADGRAIRIGYAAQNGHAYVAIGRPLVERGSIPRDQVSMRTIREWLVRHPDEAGAVMDLNPSYVFFKEIPGDGPVGAQGLVLTAQRSLAVDPKFMPLGAPLWLDFADPAAPGGRQRRLVVAQDTGGAIRGPVRGDLFCGTGTAAGEQAGAMQQRGGYFLLLPKAVAERRKRVS